MEHTKAGTDSLAAIASAAEATTQAIASLDSTSSQPLDTAGISLLGLRNHLLFAYLHHLTSLATSRLTSKDLDDNKSVEQLVWYRLVLERVKSMEGKLKYQIDKLVNQALAADEKGGELDEEELLNDPMSFRPNLAALSMLDASDYPSATNSNPQNQGSVDKPALYKPPRVSAVPFPETTTKKRKSAPAPSALRSEAALSGSYAPHAEASTGLSTTPSNSALASGRAKHLARMEAYEEDNMTRIWAGKKESKRRRLDEEDVALGGRGVTSADAKGRRKGGLEAEFSDVLGAIGGPELAEGRRNKRKGKGKQQDNASSTKKDPYAELRQRSKDSKAVKFAQGKRGDHQSGPSSKRERRPQRGAFDRALKKAQKMGS